MGIRLCPDNLFLNNTWFLKMGTSKTCLADKRHETAELIVLFSVINGPENADCHVLKIKVQTLTRTIETFVIFLKSLGQWLLTEVPKHEIIEFVNLLISHGSRTMCMCCAYVLYTMQGASLNKTAHSCILPGFCYILAQEQMLRYLLTYL